MSCHPYDEQVVDQWSLTVCSQLAEEVALNDEAVPGSCMCHKSVEAWALMVSVALVRSGAVAAAELAKLAHCSVVGYDPQVAELSQIACQSEKPETHMSYFVV